MMKRKISLFLLVMMIAGLFAGCNVGDDGDYVAELKIGYYKAGYGTEFVDAWTRGYNEAHPDEKIKFIVDPDVGGDVIGTRLENNVELCDVFMVMETGWQNWARSGWIEPLDTLMDMENDDGKLFKDVLRDGYEKFGLVNDVRYVLPQTGAAAPGFAYDETLFKKHNLKVPETMTELYALIDQINALDIGLAPFAWGGLVAGYWNSAVLTWWAQRDGIEKVQQFFDMEDVSVYRDRSGLEYALGLFQKLVCTGEGEPKNSLPQAMSKNHLTMQTDFVYNRAAMMVGVYGLQNETKLIVSPDSVFKMFYPPFVDDAKTDENGKKQRVMVTEGQDFMFIPKNSQNKDYAKKFLLWISTNEMCRQYTKYSSFLAPYKYDMDNIEGVSALTQSLIDTTKDIKIVGHIFSENPIVNQLKLHVWGSIYTPYAGMVLNNTSPAKAMESAAFYAESNWKAIRDELGLS